MKILVVRLGGRTTFELGEYCKDALTENGHNVELFTYTDERVSSRIPFFRNTEKSFIKKIFFKKISYLQPQLILVIKGNTIPAEVIQSIREKFRIPIANYWVDDPDSIEISKKLSPLYDYFFTNASDCVQIHKDAGCPNPAFLTFGCKPKLHRRVRLRDYEFRKYGSDVCFAGTMNRRRAEILESLVEFNLRAWSPSKVSPVSPLYKGFVNRAVWGEELVKVYNASKIILNIHSPQPVPIMRDFEVTACGAFLLTDYVRGLEDIFKIGEEMVCYGNEKELKDLIDFYLKHPGEREKIAQKGQQRACGDHTYAHRMKELISFCRISCTKQTRLNPDGGNPTVTNII